MSDKEIMAALQEIKQLLGDSKTEKRELVIKPGIFEGKPEPRSYKMYPNVIEALNRFTETHPQYRTQDIVCAAVLEFIEKYE